MVDVGIDELDEVQQLVLDDEVEEVQNIEDEQLVLEVMLLDVTDDADEEVLTDDELDEELLELDEVDDEVDSVIAVEVDDEIEVTDYTLHTILDTIEDIEVMVETDT